jgi:chitosanase
VSQYVDVRTEWLKSLKDPLPTTVYRMESFRSLIAAAKWDLALPLVVHGVEISEVALDDEAQAQSATPAPRPLMVTTPYLRGDDVSRLQTALRAKGLPTGQPDGVYGPFTGKLVAEWQRQQTPPIIETGVGPQTRASLGL